jgi:hypothetical protein
MIWRSSRWCRLSKALTLDGPVVEKVDATTGQQIRRARAEILSVTNSPLCLMWTCEAFVEV